MSNNPEKNEETLFDTNPDSTSTVIVDQDQLDTDLQPGSDDKQLCMLIIAGSDVGRLFPLPEKQRIVVGRSSRADVEVNDPDISRKHIKVNVQDNTPYVADLDSANGTYVDGEKITGKRKINDGDKIKLGSSTVVKFDFFDELEERFQKKLFRAALRDDLTSAYNKRYFKEQLENEFSFAERHRSPISLLLFDIDDFGFINNKYGHQVGDEILVKLVELVQEHVRKEDIFARFGGEEFVMLCRDTRLNEGASIATRLREIIADTEFKHRGNVIDVTTSVGVATYPELAVSEPEELVEAADEALYAAKNAGRNRVMVKSDSND